MPAWRMRLFARTRRWPIVAGATRNAEAIAAASKPSTTCRMSGARTPSSIAGCAQANIRRRRWSGISDSISTSASSCTTSALSSLVRRRRAASMSLRRATVSSHASGARGTPLAGQSASAAANASDSASSAPATSRVRAASIATSLP